MLGTLEGSFYRLFVADQAAGNALVYFDLFNAAGSGVDLYARSIIPIVSGDVIVTGALGVDLYLTRTSAVGTGGTAATASGTDVTATTISPMAYGAGPVPAQVTARITPTGGATAGAVISKVSLFTEETNAGTYFAHTNDFVRRGMMDLPDLVVTPGTGLRVVQSAIALVGNLSFDVIFSLRQK